MLFFHRKLTFFFFFFILVFEISSLPTLKNFLVLALDATATIAVKRTLAYIEAIKEADDFEIPAPKKRSRNFKPPPSSPSSSGDMFEDDDDEPSKKHSRTDSEYDSFTSDESD